MCHICRTILSNNCICLKCSIFLCFSTYVMRFHSNGPTGPKGVGSVLRYLQAAIHFSWFLFVSIVFLPDSILHMKWIATWECCTWNMALERTIKQASGVIMSMFRQFFCFIALVLLETQTEMCQVSQNSSPCETLVCHLKPRLEYSPQHLFGTRLFTHSVYFK